MTSVLMLLSQYMPILSFLLIMMTILSSFYSLENKFGSDKMFSFTEAYTFRT
jgi:hypothetical protein